MPTLGIPLILKLILHVSLMGGQANVVAWEVVYMWCRVQNNNIQKIRRKGSKLPATTLNPMLWQNFDAHKTKTGTDRILD